MTTLRHEVSRTYIRKLSEVQTSSVVDACRELSSKASDILERQGIPPASQQHSFQADMRYQGQALSLPVTFALPDLENGGFTLLEQRRVCSGRYEL
jgi:N-methylhydantoinase A/oxoprolinase/acetone carboxylase beta subunit